MPAVRLDAAQAIGLQLPGLLARGLAAQRDEHTGRAGEKPQQKRDQAYVHAIEQHGHELAHGLRIGCELRDEAEHRVDLGAAQLGMIGECERRGKTHPGAELQPGNVLPQEKPGAVQGQKDPGEQQGASEQPDRASLMLRPHVGRILAVKLHASLPGAVNTFTGYGEGYVMLNARRRETSVVVLPERVVEWPARSFDALTLEDFSFLLELNAEIVLLGTGARQRFPHPRLTRSLAAAGVGLEVMDVQAACRTYNILVAEGRKVAAALLFA